MPEAADEALRDLVRAREDAVAMQRQARHRLQALLLRNDIRYVGKTAWTPAHQRWIARLKLPHAAQQIAFEEYVQAVQEATTRIDRLTAAIQVAVSTWRWQPVVARCKRCAACNSSMRCASWPSWAISSRFGTPRALMGFLGWSPASIPPARATRSRRDHQGRQQFGAPRPGRGRVGLSTPGAQVTPIIARRQSRGAQDRARHRLEGAAALVCTLSQSSPSAASIATRSSSPIARELAGFVWAIGQQVKPGLMASITRNGKSWKETTTRNYRTAR